MLTIEVVGAWILMCIAFYGFRRWKAREVRASHVIAEAYEDCVETARQNDDYSA